MFEKILFATNGLPSCQNAADVAFDLARKYKSHLLLFHILGIPTRGFSPYVVDVATGEKRDLDQQFLDTVRQRLLETYRDQLEKCPDYELEVLAGVPHAEILRAARKRDVDLIVMGAQSEQDHDLTRFRPVAGHTMQRVAKGARCPVLIINRPCQTCWGYFANIIFSTDFSPAADSAFKFALALARQIGSMLYIFHACDLSALAPGKEVAQDQVENMVQEARGKIEELYLSQMGDFENYQVEVWEGIPYVEILKFCRERHGDLIVMAHHAREQAGGEAELGSTIEQVVLRANCPVVSVNRPHKVEG